MVGRRTLALLFQRLGYDAALQMLVVFGMGCYDSDRRGRLVDHPGFKTGWLLMARRASRPLLGRLGCSGSRKMAAMPALLHTLSPIFSSVRCSAALANGHSRRQRNARPALDRLPRREERRLRGVHNPQGRDILERRTAGLSGRAARRGNGGA